MIFDSSNVYTIVSEPRTGSTVISHMLDQLEGVSCGGEIFHPDQIYSGIDKSSIPNLEERNRDPIAFLHKIIEQAYKQDNSSKLIGFKLFFDHNPTISSYIVENKIPILLLERTNKLAQYSSLKIAKKTGQWHSKQKLSKKQEELNARRGKKIKFSIIEFLAFSIRSRYRFNNFSNILKKNNSPYYYVKYEEIFNPEKWKEIVNFLGVDSSNINTKSTFEKQNKGSLFSRFSNEKYARFCCKIVIRIPYLRGVTHMTPGLLEL